MSAIRTITNPVELLMAQIHEISRGNAAMIDHIAESQATLRAGQKEEVRLQKQLDRLLAKHKAKAPLPKQGKKK